MQLNSLCSSCVAAGFADPGRLGAAAGFTDHAGDLGP